jgi:hypothetical protein
MEIKWNKINQQQKMMPATARIMKEVAEGLHI